jgi:hypothetical protein
MGAVEAAVMAEIDDTEDLLELFRWCGQQDTSREEACA